MRYYMIVSDGEFFNEKIMLTLEDAINIDTSYEYDIYEFERVMKFLTMF